MIYMQELLRFFQEKWKARYVKISEHLKMRKKRCYILIVIVRNII